MLYYQILKFNKDDYWQQKLVNSYAKIKDLKPLAINNLWISYNLIDRVLLNK